MGRPLFSASSQPAVRLQPEPQPPTYETWTYANAFDPDSEEFFESDDAVYEAFIDPGQQIQLPLAPPTVRTVVDIVINSSSSEGTSSGRGSPMELAEVDTFIQGDSLAADDRRVLDDTRIPVPTTRNPTLDAQLDAGRSIPAEDRVQYYLSLIDRMESARERERQGSRPSVRDRVPTFLDLPQEESRGSSPEPVSPTRVVGTPMRPSTPLSHSSPQLLTPSPPPSVTPRFYSWSTYSSRAAPYPPSPLTNRGARVSVARIATPSLVPAHRAA
ncbi:hypothetical protein BC628DRAFT_1329556 [Trametes gibbosa]|nr:hypothetical protein BC628DRAFT_1329556 [Trametes gibbosa]